MLFGLVLALLPIKLRLPTVVSSQRERAIPLPLGVDLVTLSSSYAINISGHQCR